MSTDRLTTAHERTLEAVFGHPLPHNLQWHNVRALFEALGTVQEDHNGHYTVTINEQTATFHRPHHKDVADAEQVEAIRHLLERARVTPGVARSAAPPFAAPGTAPHRLLVVISHQETLIFQVEPAGGAPERLAPYDPHGYRRHLHHRQGDYEGSRAPEDPAYYERIAKTLDGADEVLIIGNGIGTSSAMVQLIRTLTKQHEAIAERIVGVLTADLEAMTDQQLSARAREFYAQQDHRAPQAG